MIILSGNPPLEHLLPLGRPGWRAMVERILESLDLTGVELELSLTGDEEIAFLNRRWLGCVGPTNVLSFPHELHEPNESQDDEESLDAQPLGEVSGPEWLGGIALSLETLRREAFLYGLDPTEYAARLLSHAVLHLSGLDHGEEMDVLTEKAVDAALRTQS